MNAHAVALVVIAGLAVTVASPAGLLAEEEHGYADAGSALFTVVLGEDATAQVGERKPWQPTSASADEWLCAFCATDIDPYGLGLYAAAWGFEPILQCEEDEGEFVCAWCEHYLGHLCTQYDDPIGDSEDGFISYDDAFDWLWDDLSGWHCELHRCFESQVELQDLMLLGDVDRLANLIAQSEGRVLVNHERRLLQLVGCDGKLAGQVDIARGPLSRLLVPAAHPELDNAPLARGPARLGRD
jgi:hypothetical protein